jgi:hypothetical protein
MNATHSSSEKKQSKTAWGIQSQLVEEAGTAAVSVIDGVVAGASVSVGMAAVVAIGGAAGAAGVTAAVHDACDSSGVDEIGAAIRAPISTPITKSSMHSSSAHVTAMVTIREVIEKAYCIGLWPQGIIVVNCAGVMIWITPAHAHISFDVF